MFGQRVWGILLIFFVGYTAQLCSQISFFPFHKLNQSNGLPDLKNSYLSEDSKGFIWIGGFDGLNRFDGKTVKSYRPILPNGSYSPNITSKVMESKDGKRWFSTSGALHCIDPKTDSVSAIILKDTQGRVGVNNEHVLVHLDQDSRLWVVAQDWLHLYNYKTGKDSLLHPLLAFSCYPLLDSEGKVTGLLNLLAAQGGGIEVFDYTKGNLTINNWFTSNTQITPQALILFACTEGDSLLWLPSNIGLIRFPLKSPRLFTIINPPEFPAGVKFKDVCSGEDQSLFLASADQGLFMMDKRSGSNGFLFHQPIIEPENGTTAPSVINNVFLSKDQTLWLSIWDQGVFFTNLKQTKFQTERQEFHAKATKQEAITAVQEDKDQNLWIATETGGITKKSASKANIPSFERSKGGMPNKIFCDSAGNVWAFNNATVFLKKRKARSFKRVARHLDRLYKIVQRAPTDFLFICPAGVYNFNLDKSWAPLTPFVRQNNIFNAFTDQEGRLFLSDEVDKLWVYQGLKSTPSLIKEITGVGYSNGMVESGKLRWFATNKGLLKLNINDLSTEFIKGKDRVLETSFNAILQDAHQNLWLSSNSGLFRYNPTTGEVKHYTESDGLQGMQFMLGSACKLSDGRLAFGGVNGLNIFHPDSIRDNPNPPMVHFTDWIVNDTGSVSHSPDYLKNPSFSYNKRTLSFYFIGIDYAAPDEVRYRYRLQGFEKDTVEGGTNGFARYGQLPSGTYTFQVWAANSDGVWTAQPKELQFTILPPWYATWWARSIALLGVAALLYAFLQNRISHIRRKEADRRKEAEFRQKEAESKQLAAELQNAVLRLQMNPHFIFNSMNSISSYILQKDVETANDYLHRFAKLMRLILDLAARPLIPIADEIELLEQYMMAEAMRFEQKFTWSLTLDPELDPEEVFLPTMILQPFVENAIWHGFSGKNTSGHIRISFQKQANLLYCCVEDDGVGRKASVTKKQDEHTSSAIEITTQRLQLLENKALHQNNLNIIDLYQEDGLPSGTRVELRLPLDL